MAKVVIKSNRKEFDRILDRAMRSGLLAAGKRLQQLTQDALNKPAMRSRGPRGGVVWSNVSRPGEPPRLREGTLRRNIHVEEDRANHKVRIGWRKNVEYGMFHELGIDYGPGGRQKRPHLLPTFTKSKSDLEQVFAANARAAIP